MQYEKPDLEILLLEWNNIICKSLGVDVDDDDNGDDWTQQGGEEL